MSVSNEEVAPNSEETQKEEARQKRLVNFTKGLWFNGAFLFAGGYMVYLSMLELKALVGPWADVYLTYVDLFLDNGAEAIKASECTRDDVLDALIKADPRYSQVQELKESIDKPVIDYMFGNRGEGIYAQFKVFGLTFGSIFVTAIPTFIRRVSCGKFSLWTWRDYEIITTYKDGRKTSDGGVESSVLKTIWLLAQLSVKAGWYAAVTGFTMTALSIGYTIDYIKAKIKPNFLRSGFIPIALVIFSMLFFTHTLEYVRYWIRALPIVWPLFWGSWFGKKDSGENFDIIDPGVIW